MTDPRRRFGPVHECRVCGAPVDPVQVANLDGVCGRMACRVAVRARAEGETLRIERDRRLRARTLLLADGVDPEASDWSLVPANPAESRPLSAKGRKAFARHLRRVLEEVEAHPETGPSSSAATDVRAEAAGGAGTESVAEAVSGAEAESPTDPESEALRRGCAACRGWCCRRGGTHAFLDARSLQRVRDEHPASSPRELENRYLRHLGPTHLEGGCVFQGETGCRLPRALRSDTCNRWLCDDLLEVRRHWRKGTADPERTRFVAVPPRNARDA